MHQPLIRGCSRGVNKSEKSPDSENMSLVKEDLNEEENK